MLRATAFMLLGSSALAVGAGGQTVSATTTPQTQAIEEIIVTARRREETLQEAPVSITAFSAAALESRNITKFSDLNLAVPNVTIAGSISNSQGGFNVGIRGLAQADFLNTADPAVGLYVDGVYMARTVGNMLDVLDVERIEVLRGPQGVLYGKNTIGGTVNVVSRKPQRTTEGSIAVTAGSRDRLDFRGIGNVAFSDKLFGKVVAASFSQDGYGTLLLTGNEQADTGSIVGQAQLRYVGDGGLEVLLSVDRMHQRQKGAHSTLVAYVPNATTDFYNSVVGADIGEKYVLPLDQYESWADLEPDDDLDVWGAAVTADWQIGAASFKSITAYRKSEWDGGLDIGATPFPLVQQFIGQDHDQISQEIQVTGEKLGALELNWILGAFYMDEQSVFQTDAVILGGTFEAIGLDASIIQLSDQTVKTHAVFAHATYPLTERLSGSFGVRFSSDEKTFTGELFRPLSGAVVFPRGTAKERWSDVSPKLGLDYELSDTVLLYGSVARGFRSGGFNGRAQAAAVAFLPFDQEEVTQFEVGVKSEWLDHRLRANLAVFFSDYKDIQLTAFAGGQGAQTFDTVVSNAASADIYGGELEILAVPTEHLTIDFGFGYTKNSFQDIAQLAIDAGVQPGNTLPRAPEFTGNVGVDYRLPISNRGILTFRVDYARVSSFDFSAKNTALQEENGYALSNARISFTTLDSRWDFAAYGRNIFDEAYRSHAQSLEDSLGVVTAFPGRPREYGVTVRYAF